MAVIDRGERRKYRFRLRPARIGWFIEVHVRDGQDWRLIDWHWAWSVEKVRQKAMRGVARRKASGQGLTVTTSHRTG